MDFYFGFYKCISANDSVFRPFEVPDSKLYFSMIIMAMCKGRFMNDRLIPRTAIYRILYNVFPSPLL
jgi:hypothetical protein